MHELRKKASSFLSDILYVNLTLTKVLQKYNDRSNPDYHKPVRWQEPFYPDWGLYLSDRHLLGKFEFNLSHNLTMLYNRLLEDEDARKNYNAWVLPTYNITPQRMQNEIETHISTFYRMMDDLEGL